ncbi:unnamed protein product, partial [Ixodes pacificus]
FFCFRVQIFLAGTDALSDEAELFSVEYCGTNCTLLENGSWTACPGKNGTCRCFHESGQGVGLCLSTEYTDFSEYPDPNSSEIAAATPLPRVALIH